MRVALSFIAIAVGLAANSDRAFSNAPFSGLAARDPLTQMTLVAGGTAQGEQDATEEKEAAKHRTLTARQKRDRAALEQRRLLQEKEIPTRIQRNQQNLDAIRADQAERLRLQQQTQRRMMYQQRQLAQPQQPGQAPRLTPLDPPLMDQTHPRCGVPGMPLC